ncbi:putative armadillo-like helical protein [Helianthus anomalus]
MGKVAIHAWLSYLPIKGDLFEAKSVHEILCSLGPNNRYVPKIVSIFAEVSYPSLR